MKKVVPLVHMNQIENYISSGVDAVLMGTYFGATRQVEVYTLDEMIETNQKIPVIGCYNRFYFEHEIEQLKHELKALDDAGVKAVVGSDLAVLELVHELDLELRVILDTDTTMTNVLDVNTMRSMGAVEVVLGRELTLEEMLHIAEETTVCGVHLFGYQLTSFSRRKHLTQYAQLRNLDLPEGDLFWIKEKSRDTKYMTLEDVYGTHVFAPDVYSLVHAYHELKAHDIQSVYFDVIGLEIEDVLFIVRSLDLLEDAKAFETIIEATTGLTLTHGLLYQETEKGRRS